jgi:hypothetical protein
VHATDSRLTHSCSGAEDLKEALISQSEDEKAKRYECDYEVEPTPTQALSLSIIEKNCAYSLADSKYITEFLMASKTPVANIENFYDSKVIECIKQMGWEKSEKNNQASSYNDKKGKGKENICHIYFIIYISIFNYSLTLSTQQ